MFDIKYLCAQSPSDIIDFEVLTETMDEPATSDADEQARRTLVRPCSSQASLSFTSAFAGCY